MYFLWVVLGKEMAFFCNKVGNLFLLVVIVRIKDDCAVLCLVAQSCLTLCDSMDCSRQGSSVRGDSLGKNTGVGCHTLLQGIFPTKGSNLDLPHCRWILYRLSHQGSPRILEWVDYPFSRGFSWWRNWTRVSCVASQADSLPGELPEKPGHKTINSKYRKQTARQSS